jgi:RHS repeat-associated protein
VDGDCAVPAQLTTTIRGLDGKVLRIYNQPFGGAWKWERDYVYRDGQLLASVEPSTEGGEDTVHFHLDHLGSPRQVTDEAGAQAAFHTYYPFGGEATVPSQDDVELKFTGHERDENGGGAGVLDYMHARFCGPALGRFLSVDPVGGDRSAPQSWNRYSYVRNQALNLVDPRGETIYFPALSEPDENSPEFRAFEEALREADVEYLINYLSLKSVDGEIVLSTGILDFRKLSNPTANLIGEAIATGTRIGIKFGSVKKKHGGGVTDTRFYDKQNLIDIKLDPKQIASILVPGRLLSGPSAGLQTALSISLPTALVHELGHAYGNFFGGQPGYFGNTIPYALRAENRHRALARVPTERTAHCALFPRGSC